jgi:ZIP family zinc transporter
MHPWVIAAGWGAAAASGLFVGALLGFYRHLDHARIAALMASAAGMVIAALSLDMMHRARVEHGLAIAGSGFALGALAFTLANRALSRWGAHHRKRCGVCMPQPSEQEQPGSGLALALGSLLDAVPEGLVIGLGLRATESSDLALVIGFAISNVPESLSSASGMRLAGRSARYVLGLWGGVVLATVAATVVGSVVPGDAGAWPTGLLESIAAGAMLAMVVETMVPEAAARGPQWNGALAAAGFLLVLAFLGLAH